MRREGPTVPNLGRNEPDASADSHARSEMPTWPVETERRRRVREAQQTHSGGVSAVAFGLSLGANVVLLVGVLGLLALIQAGVFASGGVLGRSTAGQALSATTATSSPSSSPSPNAVWLQLAPSSVQLGCASGQRTQFVTLQNTGPAKVRWQATFSVPTQKAGVAVSPQQGELVTGGSIAIQLQNTSRSSGQQGVINFAPTTPDAGPPASLAYTTAGCH
jgi:hypothetical protein